MIATAKDRIAPGVYRVDGEVQVHVPELLETLNIPDTPENRAEMVKVVQDAMVESGMMQADETVETVNGSNGR